MLFISKPIEPDPVSTGVGIGKSTSDYSPLLRSGSLLILLDTLGVSINE